MPAVLIIPMDLGLLDPFLRIGHDLMRRINQTGTYQPTSSRATTLRLPGSGGTRFFICNNANQFYDAISGFVAGEGKVDLKGLTNDTAVVVESIVKKAESKARP